MERQQHMPYLVDSLQKLAQTPSPTGMTGQVEALLMQELSALGLSPWQTRKGGVLVQLNPGAEGDGILLSAHIDTLGLMVRAVKSNGRLRFTKIGGCPFNYAEQENVTVWTRGGKSYEGTVRLNEPAVHGRRDVETVERKDDNMEIVLDERVHNAEDVTKLGIGAGDFVSLDPRFRRSGDGFVKSRHLDDKASSAVLLSLAHAFKQGEAACARPVYVMFTNYEEVGHGASAGQPDNITDMIAVDMGVVADDLKTDEYKVSICAKDSTGPFDYALTNALIDAARRHELAYAVDVYPFYGSDTAAALSAGRDWRHALVGPGVAASHGYERVHEDGLWNTLLLLKHYLQTA